MTVSRPDGSVEGYGKKTTNEELKKLIEGGFAEMRASFERIDGDFVEQDVHFEKLTEAINKKPDREDFPALLDKMFEFTTLKIQVEHLRKVVKEKLGVDI